MNLVATCPSFSLRLAVMFSIRYLFDDDVCRKPKIQHTRSIYVFVFKDFPLVVCVCVCVISSLRGLDVDATLMRLSALAQQGAKITNTNTGTMGALDVLIGMYARLAARSLSRCPDL